MTPRTDRPGHLETVSFRAMGSPCRITVDGERPGLAVGARGRVEQLERLWSRFMPTSEVSQLNRHAGALTLVSDETYELLSHAQQARQLTDGCFNPLMLDQLERLGYEAPWSDAGPTRAPLPTGPASTEPVELMPEIRGVRIPPGTAFDPGGIGKGLAVDRITDWLWSQGATTTAVELGGDLRVEGRCWFDDEWRIGVTDPFDDGREAAVTDLVAVTTCAHTAWRAEVAAKTALMAGSTRGLALLRQCATPGMAHTTAGDTLIADATDESNHEVVSP